MTDGGRLRVLCVSGDSGSGKTALIRRLVPCLPRPPGRIGVVKHTHHAVDWHPDGKDSRALWEAGPGALCVAGPDQTAVFLRVDGTGATRDAGAATRRLAGACRRLPPEVRLVLAEGFRRARAPTLWTAAGPPGRAAPGPEVVGAVVPGEHRSAWAERHPGLPVHGRGDVEAIAARVADAAAPLEELETEASGG